MTGGFRTPDYEAEFVTQLYRIFFGREPDPAGFQHYLAALNSDLQPHDLVSKFVGSDEFKTRWRRQMIPHPELPDLRHLHPNHYEDHLYLAENDDRICLMDALIHEHRYYDSAGVWGSIIDKDKLNMAQLVQCTGAKRCLEIGCFNGPILSVLSDRGLAVTGVDLSHLAFIIAFPNIRKNIMYGDLLNAALGAEYDCILLLDVMEHLNPLCLHRHIQRLRDLLHSGGLVIVNSPMFGQDPIFGTVFQQYLEQWREIGDRSFFRHWPSDEKGWPMHGHMIWASPRWWTRQFENSDLIRQHSIEEVIQDELSAYFDEAPARRSMIVLGHRDGWVDTDGICEAIKRQRWA